MQDVGKWIKVDNSQIDERKNKSKDKKSRKAITKMLSLSLEKHINPKNDTRIYVAKEVTFDYATSHAIRVDYMRFKPINNTVSGPEEVYAVVSKEIPHYVGVYVPDGINYKGEWYNLKCVSKARRCDRNRPVSEMLLMMFRSCARGGFLNKPNKEEENNNE